MTDSLALTLPEIILTLSALALLMVWFEAPFTVAILYLVPVVVLLAINSREALLDNFFFFCYKADPSKFQTFNKKSVLRPIFLYP